ncbi:rRNA maturation RNase YbeY [Helicobacter jaachi]|uniref:Endoribonuclease YbeY n=1 Tax=Helicobacter jaachi TaxID=1677920 RepID=A0A4U8T9B0_9HELI|nr:rRNA maturation RNase YbeY [Helicobacter jaachi]TLD96376.1 rRNA maturation RNase YbeY [Helicobacter jaachi]
MDSFIMPRLEIAEHKYDFLHALMQDIQNLALIERDLSHFYIEVIMLDSKQMQDINRVHRGIDKSTDVLSFPLALDSITDLDSINEPLCLGSVVINVQLATQMAQQLHHSVQDEISLLFIHGFLHILGYDHEQDEGEQRALEQRIIESLHLKQSLIVRAQG